MDKSQVAALFEEIAVLLELQGENPFKARAYTNAARALENYEGDLAALVAEDRLGDLTGVGDALRLKITELVRTGRLDYYEKLRASVPAGLVEMLEVPALGPKKIKTLHDKLGISSVADLEAACRTHRVRDLAGFGAKTEERILAGIGQSRDYADHFLYAGAWAQAEEIREALRYHEGVSQVSFAGDIRRARETVTELEFVASSREPEEIVDYFVSLRDVKKTVRRGMDEATVLLESGIPATLHVVGDKAYAAALHHFTGSAEHRAELQARAESQDKRLDERGLFEIKRGRKKSPEAESIIPCRTEDDLFEALGLHSIPPELREGRGEIATAAEHKLPRLVEWTQLRGTFHCHTKASDGRNTLEEMAAEARELGLDYLGIADHSKSSFQANGLSEERLVAQIAQIEKRGRHPQGRAARFRRRYFGPARLRRRVGA
jgi:DNA polymerase (family 10)